MFVVGGLGFEFRVFVAGWRHALRSEWPFIIIIIIIAYRSLEWNWQKEATHDPLRPGSLMEPRHFNFLINSYYGS